MQEEYLVEFVSGLGRWLGVWVPAHRDLGRVFASLRRAVESTEDQDALREAIHEAVDLLFQYDPDRFGSVAKYLPSIPLEDHDAGRLTQFLRRHRPGEGASAQELLEWLGEYHAVIGIALDYVEDAQLEILRDQGLMPEAAGPATVSDRPLIARRDRRLILRARWLLGAIQEQVPSFPRPLSVP